MRCSAIHLIGRGLAEKSSSKLGISLLPFSFLCSTFHNVSHKGGPFLLKPRIDFTCINEVDDAIFLFREMLRMRPRPSIVEFTKLLNVIVKMKNYPAALSVFDKMRQSGVPVDEYTMTIAIHCYCLLRRPDFGFAMLGNFFKCGYKPDATTYNTLIKGLFLDDKVSEAEILFKKLWNLKLCEPNEVTILTVINGLCKAGQTVTACNLLGLLEKTRCKPGVESYNVLLDSLCKHNGMVDDALHLFSKMIGMGISPNVITYTCIIQGLCDFGRWKEVENMLKEMMDHKISLDVITFSVLVDAFCKEGKVKEAENVVKLMMQRNVCPNTVTYSALIDGYCMQGEMDKARNVFDSISDRGLKPCIICYSALINGYCKKGMVDEAWHLLLEIPKGLEHTAATYNPIIQGLFQQGRFAEGWKLFSVMEAQDIIPDLHSYGILLDGLCRSKHIDAAFSFLSIMEDKGVNPNIITYGILIDGLCKNGKLDIARNVFTTLTAKGLQPNVKIYNMIIGSLFQEGLLEEAKHLLLEMEKSGCVPNSVTYNVIIQGLLKRNELCKTMPFLEEMHKRGFSADSTTVSMLLDQLQRQGKDDGLLKMIEKVVPKE